MTMLAERKKNLMPGRGLASAWRQAVARFTALALVPILAAAVAACTPSSRMTGIVKDNFGNLLEGVTVTVDKTDYVATTDKTGRYTVPFDPGVVNVKFTKDGYAIGHFGIRLADRRTVPIDVVVLEKFPPGDGLWMVSAEGYFPTGKCQLRMDNSAASKATSVVVVSGGPALLPPGTSSPRVVTFIDDHIWENNGIKEQ